MLVGGRLTDFSVTAERAARILTVTGSGSWVLGLPGTLGLALGSWATLPGPGGRLGLGSWGQGPRPVSGANTNPKQLSLYTDVIACVNSCQ